MHLRPLLAWRDNHGAAVEERRHFCHEGGQLCALASGIRGEQVVLPVAGSRGNGNRWASYKSCPCVTLFKCFTAGSGVTFRLPFAAGDRGGEAVESRIRSWLSNTIK
jgi:hypothetical protein